MPSVTSSPGTCSGFPRTGHVHRIAVVGADILKRGVLLAIDKVDGGRHIQFCEANARRGVPHADQLLGMGVGKRLQEHALDYAENDRVCAHTDGESNEGNGGKQRRPAEPAQDLLEVVSERCHASASGYTCEQPGERLASSEMYYAIGRRKVPSSGRIAGRS